MQKKIYNCNIKGPCGPMDKALVYETKDSRFDPGHGLSANGADFTKILFYLSRSQCHSSVWVCQGTLGGLCSWARPKPIPELAVAGQPQHVGKHRLAGLATLQLELPADVHQLKEAYRTSRQFSA